LASLYQGVFGGHVSKAMAVVVAIEELD